MTEEEQESMTPEEALDQSARGVLQQHAAWPEIHRVTRYLHAERVNNRFGKRIERAILLKRKG